MCPGLPHLLQNATLYYSVLCDCPVVLVCHNLSASTLCSSYCVRILFLIVVGTDCCCTFLCFAVLVTSRRIRENFHCIADTARDPTTRSSSPHLSPATAAAPGICRICSLGPYHFLWRIRSLLLCHQNVDRSEIDLAQGLQGARRRVTRSNRGVVSVAAKPWRGAQHVTGTGKGSGTPTHAVPSQKPGYEGAQKDILRNLTPGNARVQA